MVATTSASLDWKQFEQTLFSIYWQDAQAFLAANPQESIYALALNGLYREQDGPIYLPTLSANSERAYSQMVNAPKPQSRLSEFDLDTGQLGTLRWNPPDWEWEALDSASDSQELEQLEQALLAEANKSTPAHWLRTEAHLIKALIRICKQLTKACQKSPWASQLTPEFAVLIYVQDTQECEALARQSMGQARFLALFPSHDLDAQRRARVAALSPAQQLQYHLSCLEGIECTELGLSRKEAQSLGEEAEAALLVMDHRQVAHALLPMLTRPGKQWRAAMLLAQMAYRDEQILTALRQQVQAPIHSPGQESERGWCASALGALGDQEWLQQQIGGPAVPAERIAQGIAHPYRSWNSKPGTTPLHLDYAPLERALDLKHPALTQALNEELSPGGGYCSLRVADLEQALCALQSAHALVRVHAACIMGERSLGAAAGRRITPALAQALSHDSNDGVRYQAMLGLRYWKKASAAQRASIEHAAAHDACDNIRELAQQWLGEHG
ncbi:DUF4303 domain-containing protein [Comamonas testosteroni]|uniref:DUF4303 domain-containing protein n=1 Tax=Comamonas testosteroni TaxID=285 RepID=UPI0026F36856|nr:DUF4303 domain-containing protein [Comamonas testosteroni]WQD41666.1 DUF4303 domain-containing protein [Comamonas testosteroni]